MNKSQKRMLFLSASLLPIIPMLFLYNQNSENLYFPQIIIAGLVLIVIVTLFFRLCQVSFHSELTAFVGCLIFVELLFAYNIVYHLLSPYGYSHIILLPIVPLLSYILAFIFHKYFGEMKFEKLPFLITVFVSVMLVINLFSFFQKAAKVLWYQAKDGGFTYKTSFTVNNKLQSPNIYWIFCDGMLGFDAMEKYFHNSQEGLTAELTRRGFSINKVAKFETGHLTRITIPTLMCPDYYDKYLVDILKNHKTAMELRDTSDTELYDARVNNETINAFDAKGYTTVTMSLYDVFLLPTTDYFYYITAQYKSSKDYISIPYLVKKLENRDESSYKIKLFANKLGEIFLGGIPGYVCEKLYKDNEIIKQPLLTSFENASDVLLGSTYGKVNLALINSLYDSLYSANIEEPKFILIHDLMAHCPFNLDENGNKVDDVNNILSYPGHHTYATKVLVNLVDMILDADPDAVIVLQADHGLHAQTEKQITKGLGNPEAAIDIWNSVFSAIRVPERYQNGDEYYAMKDPRNISRFLVNNFVGYNYCYITDEQDAK